MGPRITTLQGAANFRDLGGYPTLDGRRIRWARIFRSDKLSSLSDNDLEIVETYDIRAVVDLRTRAEQSDHPSRWRTTPAAIYISPKPNNDEIIDLFMRNIASCQDAIERMELFYADLPFRYQEEFASLFAALGDCKGATLVHCTAGKDRTGVACALILCSLGVGRKTIIEDYVLTETLMDSERLAHLPDEPIGDANQYGLLDDYSSEIRLAIWRSEARYITAALEAIDQHFGSLESYFEEALGISAARLSKLRELYTTDA